MTLDWREKQKVQYVIPLWLRDEQIRSALSLGLPCFAPNAARRDEPVAIACYGPSLRETWEQIRGFDHVISCSGAHRFLIDRELVPHHHVAVDPLPGNTVKLIGAPHPDVEYLIASTCHPDVFAHLKGQRVKLWHVFDSTEEGQRLIPPGQWSFTGGCDVGLRSIVLAAAMGFRDLHVFGMDGSASSSGPGRHAGDHPAPGKQYADCEYDGVVYKTTASMLEAARSVWHELDQLPAVSAKFYGDGLVQHMARNYVPKPQVGPLANVLGLQTALLITEEYRGLNAQLHRDNLGYGVGGGRHAPAIKTICEKLGTTSVLDYGCGKGYLARALPFPIWEYDPAIPGKTETPRPADVVVCTDVLEHIEPEQLRAVLGDLARCTRKVGYFTIHTGAASKTLADGRNTHLIQRPVSWWKNKLLAYFDVGKIFVVGLELHVVVAPKKTDKYKRVPISVVKAEA